VADDFAENVAGIAALAEPVRRDLYRYVVAQGDPVSRDQAAAGVGVPRHTVKFHLDKLVEEGLLDTEFRRLGDRQGPGAGRPTKLYRRSGREVSVTVPERRYDLAGQLLASAVEESAREGTPVLPSLHRVAAAWGARLGDEARAAAGPRPGRDRLVGATCDVLASHGYEPRADDRSVTLANCPFHALARDHTELVCDMNLALVSAVARNGGDARLSARLDPADGRCCVVLDVH
jgi:predicted ArsR family transcriptional regulator